MNIHNCTCGSTAIGSDNHSNWCDSLIIVLDHQESSWDKFQRMALEGWSGTYVYVTLDANKLNMVSRANFGTWLVQTPDEFLNYAYSYPGSAAAAWIENEVADSDVMDMANMFVSRAGTVYIVDGQ